MNLSDRVIERIKSYEDFESSMQTIRKNSYGPIFLVGGKVYRTIIEELTGRDVGAAIVDWDALCFGDVKPTHIPEGWRRNFHNSASKLNSLGLEKGVSRVRRTTSVNKRVRFNPYYGGASGPYQSINKGAGAHKIDIIGIKDVPGGRDLQSYFNIVPLDVQRVALSLENGTLHGVNGLKAIKSGHIRINSTEGSLPGLEITSYIKRKAESIGFTYEGQAQQGIPCDCFEDSRAMLFSGCKFPKFHI